MKYFSKRVILSPAAIILVVASLSLVLNLIFFDDINAVHFYFMGGVFTFILFYFIFSIGVKRNNYQYVQANKIVLNIYFLFSVSSIFISFYILYSKGFSNSGNFLNNLRYAHVIEESSSFGIGGLSLFSIGLSLYYLTRERFRISFILLLFSIIPSIALVERTSLLMNLTIYFFFGLWLNLIRIKYVFFGVLSFIVLSLLVAIGTNRISSDVDSTGRDVSFLISYIGYGITSFSRWIYLTTESNCYSTVFGVFGNVLDNISGLYCNDLDGATIGEFNVYTYMHAPYIVFGVKGIFILMALLGVFYAFLFRKAMSSIYYLYLLSIFIYPLVMVFYAWQFSLNTYLYAAIIFFPLSHRFKFK